MANDNYNSSVRIEAALMPPRGTDPTPVVVGGLLLTPWQKVYDRMHGRWVRFVAVRGSAVEVADFATMLPLPDWTHADHLTLMPE